MTEEAIPEVRGERALREGEFDRLGFGEVAARIANAITDRASSDGLVIGLDGEWGSGKSSLLTLIESELGRRSEEDRPTIISFRPWLVGNRDALLTSLFSELAEKIAKVNFARGDSTSDTKLKAERAAKTIRAFARALGRAGDVVEVAGELWAPAKHGGRLLKGLRNWAEQSKEEETTDLAALKDRIKVDLKELGHRFIVTVDDVDRLEPAEVIEVLRLVRSVADFPNVVYILCYDVDRLAEAIENGADIEEGERFLEKIVQLTVMVPKPEPFELRQWFADDLAPLVGTLSDEAEERLKMVIDQEGGNQLRTPRSVVRTLDSIRFFWPAMRAEQIDVADLVWLQLVKDGAPALYRWAETYVASVAATSFGTATVTETTVASREKDLGEVVGEGLLDDMMYRNFLSEILPGLEARLGDGDEPPVRIHREVDAQNRQSAIAGRRLASPDHYRMYFGLIGPSHAVTQQGFDLFWSAVDDGPDAAAAVLLDLQGQQALGSLRKSDVLFERLRGMDENLWTPARARSVLLALGAMMDEAEHRTSRDRNIISGFDRAGRLVPILLRRLDPSERGATIDSLFGSGAAVGWLTTLLRRETFAQGRYGGHKRTDSEWYLTPDELDRVSEIMIARYKALSFDDLASHRRPISMLFAWSQAGDPDGPRTLLAKAAVTDAGLIKVIDTLTSGIESSDRGRYTVLKKENVEPFLDFGRARERLEHIAKGDDAALAAAANRLITAADDAKYW